MAGVIEQANDVVTLFGLLAGSVLLARKLASTTWSVWAMAPVGVVALAGLAAVSDADVANTRPPSGFWTGHEWAMGRMSSGSGPEASVAASLLLSGAVAEAMACLLLCAGWAWGNPLVAAFGRQERRGEGPGCCWPLALCLPGFDKHGTAPGIVLPSLPVAPAAPVAGIMATGAASALALAQLPAIVQACSSPSQDGSAPAFPSLNASAAWSTMLEAVETASPPPLGFALTAACATALALAPAMVIASVLLRIVIVAPTRCFALRSGRSQLAVAVAAAAVLAAVAAEASKPGSSGSAVASSGTNALRGAALAVWDAVQPLRAGFAEAIRPCWAQLAATPMLGQRTLADAGTGFIVAQFGLLMTALLFGFVPAMALIGATYMALDSVWKLSDPYAGIRAMPRI